MSTIHVKKGDEVKILTGKDKGSTGKITAVKPEEGRVIVENRNIIVKHIKAKKKQKSSSRQKIAGSIEASNVQIICPECKKTTRVGHAEKTDAKGKAKRFRACKKCGASLDVKSVKAEKKAKKSKKDEAVKEEKKVKKVDKADKQEKPDKPEKPGKVEKNADGAVV